MRGQAGLVGVSVEKGTCKGDSGPRGGLRQNSELLAVRVPSTESRSPQEGRLRSGGPGGRLAGTARSGKGRCGDCKPGSATARRARGARLCSTPAASRSPGVPRPAPRPHRLAARPPPSKVPCATGCIQRAAGGPARSCSFCPRHSVYRGKKLTSGFSKLIVFSKPNTSRRIAIFKYGFQG